MQFKDKIVYNNITLRLPERADAKLIAEYCNDKQFSSTMISLPYPYTIDDAYYWIDLSHKLFNEERALQYLIEIDNVVVGSVGMSIDQQNLRAEIGYWVARDYCKHGYASVASQVLIDDIFDNSNVHKIVGRYFEGNDASKRVLEKLNFEYEGMLREHILKDDKFLDIHYMALFRSK